MASERCDDWPLDDRLLRIGGTRLSVRGPASAPGGIVCLGGAETYGRFVDEPFPDRLARAIGRPVANLGAVNAGIDSFLGDPAAIAATRRAALAVVQVMGADRLSNPFYTVHPRRADRFIAPTERLRWLVPDLDLSDVHFTRHLLHAIRAHSPIAFVEVIRELEAAWSMAMDRLLATIGVPVCLLWVSTRTPDDEGLDVTGPEPLLVTRPMLDRLADRVVALAEIRVPPNLSGDLLPGQHCADTQTPAALRQPGPESHADIAMRLAEVAGQTFPVSSGTASNRSATSP